jgi:hypothetical protein
MLPTFLVPALAVLSLWPTSPNYLSHVERRLNKEPAYQTRAPRYCLLVFGPEAKTRIWLVLDGNKLYVDRNGNGDLTEPGKVLAFPETGGWVTIGDIVETDGRARHTALKVRRFGDGYRMMLLTGGKRRTYVGYDEFDRLRFAERAADAPIVHIDGPLTMRLYEEPPILTPGQPAEIDVQVGTPGLGKGTFAAIECCTLLNCKAPPVAEVTFPHRDKGMAPLVVRVSIADD